MCDPGSEVRLILGARDKGRAKIIIWRRKRVVGVICPVNDAMVVAAPGTGEVERRRRPITKDADSASDGLFGMSAAILFTNENRV